MLTIIGLIALLGAVTVGVAGIQANSGDSHALPSGFTVFDHNYGGSSGLLFAYGILVGAIGTAGFILLLAGLWTTSRRGVTARRELRQSRREMAAARKELAKPVPAPQPARSVDSPRQPVVPMTKTPPQRLFARPTWSVNPFRKGPGTTPAKTESVAK
ncbi:LapA family protein [Nocardia concava]|uniref:LapA family protein n=1 Tax=Nocardia concava TaxID=257281 RepID=UPI00031628B3|nr:LapA family protein [Nocardia concava]